MDSDHPGPRGLQPWLRLGATIQKGRRGLFVELWSFESVLFAIGVWYVGFEFDSRLN